MAHDELWALVNSNARSIQAMAESIETSRLHAEAERQRIEARIEADRQRADRRQQALQETIDRLAKVVGGVANLAVSLDSDRPTVLRRLDSLESKIERIEKRLEGEEE